MKILKILSLCLALVGFGLGIFYAGYRVGERRGVFAGGCGAMDGRACSPEFRAYSARGEVQSVRGLRLLVLDRGRWEKELILSAATRLEGWKSIGEIKNGDHLFAAGHPLSNGQMEVSLIRKIGPGMGGKITTPATQKIPARTYHPRGVISALPEGPGKSLMIRHEAIPDFVDSFGEQVGMNSMTMPFEYLPGIDLGGLHPGDKVALVWVVDWGKNDARITRIEKLPADTPLVFGKAIPKAAPPATR